MPGVDLVGTLVGILRRQGSTLWGYADVRGLTGPGLASFPRAVAFAGAMDPEVMATVVEGPNSAYARLYADTNRKLDELSEGLAREIARWGYRTRAIPASVRSDPENIRGDFPHKTAATRAGLGWVGKNCQLVTRRLGPWLRLGTVLTDAPLPADEPTEKNFCGKCTACVDACPAGALTGAPWHPGLPREEILDAARCDAWKKDHYIRYHRGHNCGICAAVCPYGRKALRGGREEVEAEEDRRVKAVGVRARRRG